MPLKWNSREVKRHARASQLETVAPVMKSICQMDYGTEALKNPKAAPAELSLKKGKKRNIPRTQQTTPSFHARAADDSPENKKKKKKKRVKNVVEDERVSGIFNVSRCWWTAVRDRWGRGQLRGLGTFSFFRY